MENASKALLIAGGVLITMIVASFGVYLYGVYHDHSEKMLARMSEKEVSEFNAKFEFYENKELTPNDIVSIMNLVVENNISRKNIGYYYDSDVGSEANAPTSGFIQTGYDSDQFIKNLTIMSDIKVKVKDSNGNVTYEKKNDLLYYFTFSINRNEYKNGKVNKMKITTHKHDEW